MEIGQPASGRGLPLLALLVALGLASALVARDLAFQPAGLDFLSFWTGGRVALTEPGRLYDFQYVTALQGLDLAPGALRPYINPPSALLLLAPLSRLPFAVAYGGLMLASVAVLAAAGARAGAPWWLLVLPSVAFTIFCGQLSLLLGGLVLLGLSFRDRPVMAGLLFAAAACLKPQMLILLPFALAAQGRWATILATGVGGLLICALSVLAFGLQPWTDWFAALPRFHRFVLGDPGLLATSIAPYARLAALGWNGAWAYLLAPLAAWGVWATFRRDAPWPDQLIALMGGALLIAPYAMNYELALLAPAAAAYLSRVEDRRWPLYVLAVVLYAVTAVVGIVSLVAVLILPRVGAVGRPAPALRFARP